MVITNNNINNNINNKDIYNIFCNFKKLYHSIKQNYLLTICTIVQILAMSILYPSNPQAGIAANIIFGFMTYELSCVAGYYVHVMFHNVDFGEKYKSSTIVKSIPKSIDYILQKLVYIADFHDKIHHDSRINKLWYNIAIEAILNIIVEGVGLIALLKIVDFGIQIYGYTLKFNYPILFAWSISYSTIHNINYNIITPICHIQHHINKKTNYGSDFMDILYNTKYDDKPEEINHASINVILSMLFIIFIKDFYKPQNENRISTYFYNLVNWLVSY